MDSRCFENNVLLTQTERLTMGKPSSPKYARNKNILVIGGSGSGKTRFFVKPNIMQMHSSYVVTDPKGTILVECGVMLKRGRVKKDENGKTIYQKNHKDKNGNPIPVYEPYHIKVFNTIDFAKSMHYNPFAYISEKNREKDILKFVEVLIKNTSGNSPQSGEDFWVKAEKLLYTAYIAMIFTLSPESERNFETLIDMINLSECREEDETFKNAVDVQFECVEAWLNGDTLPAQVRLNTVVTGTYNFPGTYKITYRVNGGEYRTLADNLSTAQNYTLAASPTALGLAANERVTEIMFVFGQAPAGFAQVEQPALKCTAINGLTAGSSFVNIADVGGVYNDQWVQAISRWVTTVYGKTEPLPRTGY